MFTEMTIDQIINGAPEFNFPGLLPLVQDYLRNIEVDTDTMCTLSRYWNYVQKKASGKLMTNARFIRKYILEVRTTIVYLFSIFLKQFTLILASRIQERLFGLRIHYL